MIHQFKYAVLSRALVPVAGFPYQDEAIKFARELSRDVSTTTYVVKNEDDATIVSFDCGIEE